MSVNPNTEVNPKDAHILSLMSPELETPEEEDEVQEEAPEVLEEVEEKVEESELDPKELKRQLEELKVARAGILNDLALERDRRRKAEEQLKASTKEPEPDKDQTPADYIVYKHKEEISALESKLTELQNAMAEREFIQEAERLNKEEKEFITEVPDYYDRLIHFRRASYAALKQNKPDITEDEAVEQIKGAERFIVQQARLQGRRPMEFIVAASDKLGYKAPEKPDSTPTKVTTPSASVSQVTKATARNKTLTKTEGAAGSDRLTQDDFDKLDHDEKLVILSNPVLARQLEEKGYINRASIPVERPAFLRAV